MYTLGCNNKLFGPLYHVPDPLAASSSHAELGPVLSPVLVTSPGYPHHYSHWKYNKCCMVSKECTLK